MDSFGDTLKRANKAFNAGHLDEAATICQELTAIAPKNGPLCFLFGMVLHKSGRRQEAIPWLQQAAETHPKPAKVFSGLGCVYHALGDYPRAVEYFTRSLQLDPYQPDTFYSLGNAAMQLGQIEKAINAYRQAVELNPADYESWNNLGKALKEANWIEESIAAYERALAIHPEFAVTRGNRAIALLTAGHLEAGLLEYEWRWQLNGQRVPSRSYPQPVWNGEPIANKTLFVHAEQGLGDMIQFVRFVREARQRAGRVILECHAPLKPLFEHSDCADQIISIKESPPAFDCYIPLLSLPHLFRTTLETIPQPPYLTQPAAVTLPPIPNHHLKVGLTWAGNPTHHDDAARSIPLETLSPILQTAGVTFCSLQLPVPTRDESLLRSQPNLVTMAEPFQDFRQTAAVLGQMDLVISVDTAVAHLAGALGKPVWTLLPHSPDWRWMLQRPDSPWYPTMRLFRQTERGQWPAVIIRVADELRQLAHP